MAITYHAGRRIQGLSTDVSVDFTDNFSSDNFTDINTGVSVSSATMTFNGASNADRRSYKAFSNNISDTTWTVKFTSNFSNLGSTPAGGANVHLCALSDSNLELNGSTQDMVSIMFDNSGTVFGAYKDGSGSYTNSSVTPRISISAGTTYYWTFERTSTTNIKISCYSDSGRTTHVSNSPYNYTIPSTIQNLSYIQFAIVNVGGGGTPIGTVDDLEVIDDGTKYFPTNVQSGSRFEETDTRKIYYGALPSVTYETDFSSSTGWTISSTSYTNISGGVLNWDLLYGLVNQVRSAYYPITTADNSKWLLRFKLGIDTLTPVSSPNPDSTNLVIQLTDTAGNVFGTSVDAIGFSFFLGATSWLPKFYVYGTDNYYTLPNIATAKTTFTTTPSTGTYYIELIRNSATSVTATIYSDSNYSTVVESQTITVPSTIQSLDNIQIHVFDGNNSGTWTVDGTIDDIKFYNGVTSTDFTWTEEV